MEFLPLQNKRVAGDKNVTELWASGKHVVIIGGGDTGSDCVGTSNRHGAASVTQFELLPMPPDVERNPVWPYWPTRLRTSSSHEEGADRDWSIATKAFVGEGGKVKTLKAVQLAWKDGKPAEVPGSEFELPADLVLLAMGFVSPRAVGARGVRRGEGRARQRQGSHRRAAPLRHSAFPRSSPPATCAAASRSSSGRSAKAGSARARSTSSSWGLPSFRAKRERRERLASQCSPL